MILKHLTNPIRLLATGVISRIISAVPFLESGWKPDAGPSSLSSHHLTEIARFPCKVTILLSESSPHTKKKSLKNSRFLFACFAWLSVLRTYDFVHRGWEKAISFCHLKGGWVDQPDLYNISALLCQWLLKRIFIGPYLCFWVANQLRMFPCSNSLQIKHFSIVAKDSAFIRSIIHSQNMALYDIYISKTNHTVPQLSPISNRMDVLPHPGNRICQKFIGFTDNKSLAISQALCKLSNII